MVDGNAPYVTTFPKAKDKWHKTGDSSQTVEGRKPTIAQPITQ